MGNLESRTAPRQCIERHTRLVVHRGRAWKLAQPLIEGVPQVARCLRRKNTLARLAEAKVSNQRRLVEDDSMHVVLYLKLRPRRVPDSHLVDFAAKSLDAGIAIVVITYSNRLT